MLSIAICDDEEYFRITEKQLILKRKIEGDKQKREAYITKIDGNDNEELNLLIASFIETKDISL